MPDLLSNPNFKNFCDHIAKSGKETEGMSLDEMRKLDTEFIKQQNTPLMPVERTEDIQIPGMDNNIVDVRVYTPSSPSKNLPVGVYFHGGGWVFGNVEQADAVTRRLANVFQCIIVSVEYRLAPEFPFPKALEDCYAATRWVSENVARLNGDPANIFVIGESAGGNLAAAVALMARDLSGPKLSAQVLLYPVITSTLDDRTYAESPDQYFITKDLVKYFWGMYTQPPEQAKNPYASVDLAKLTNLPPAFIVTAEYDPLKAEGEKYAQLLRQSGVRVIEKCVPGVVHGFLFIPVYDNEQKIAWTKEMHSTFLELIQ